MAGKIDFEATRKKLFESRNLAAPLITIADPTVAETLAGTGADLLIADMEHSLIGVAELAMICIAAGELPVFARMKGLERNEVKRVLDTGVSGIIVPGIESVQDAMNAVRFSRFAPEGVRGAGPGRASGYGTGMKEYLSGKPMVFVQIETKPAFENVCEIASVPGLDGLFIGPFDLSIALQIEFSWSNKIFTDAVHSIMEEASINRLATGIYSPLDPETLSTVSGKGFNFIMLGMDREAIFSGYSHAIDRLQGRGT